MRNRKNNVMDVLFIIGGTGLMAVAVACVYEPIAMVTGGFTGVSIIIKRITETIIPGGVPLGISNLCLNIPLFLWALTRKKWRFLFMTVFATVLLSGWLWVLPPVYPVAGDYLLSSLLGGFLGGTGIGLVLRGKATTGGTDLLAVLLHTWMPHHTVVEILMVIDTIIVILGMGVFGLHSALYAMIAIYMTAKMSDRMTEGLKFAKGALIITDWPTQVAEKILEQMERGVTSMEARGMYSGQKRGMLYCVFSRKETVRLKEIVYGIDEKAFITLMDVREVLGEGFYNDFQKNP